jgi:hypothetical protein
VVEIIVHTYIPDFGDAELAVILEHYKINLEDAGVDPMEATIEWSALKSAIYTQ